MRSLRNPYCVLGLVLLWRVALLVFTAQPIPANDAFGYDGAVVNYLCTGRYCNPSLRLIFPISGEQVFSMYPPGYQVVLLPWMEFFGTSVISAMALHLVLFAVVAWLIVAIIRKYFPAGENYALAVLLFFGFTFGDRPEDLAYVFGIGSLWLVLRQITSANTSVADSGGITVLLLLMLYTSPITGAYFMGIGFLASAIAWHSRRKVILLLPFVIATIVFVAVTKLIEHKEPLWWAGFMESARQQSVMVTGFHFPALLDLVKLARTAPVFTLALALVPVVWSRRKEIVSISPSNNAWLFLLGAIFVVGWGLLALDMTLLAANYVGYVGFTQVLLAAGLLAITPKILPERQRLIRGLMAACVFIVAIRAIGMTIWGVACASKNNYSQTHETLRMEMIGKSDVMLVSSAYLYSAAEFEVTNAIDCGWYFDHAHWTNNADLYGLERLKPSKLVLTQFDYYRSFMPLLDKLRAQPDLVTVQARDMAMVRTPDSIPSMQRVVQHISWAPVLVDLNWAPTMAAH